MIYLLLIISLILEASFSNLISNSSILVPLFFLTSLTIVYPYFKNNNQNFVITCIICGLIYDIIFYNTCFINTITFGLCSAIIIFLYDYINYNICFNLFYKKR